MRLLLLVGEEGDAREGECPGVCFVLSRKRALIAPRGEDEASFFRVTFVGLIWVELADELLRVFREVDRSNALQHGGSFGVLL